MFRFFRNGRSERLIGNRRKRYGIMEMVGRVQGISRPDHGRSVETSRYKITLMNLSTSVRSRSILFYLIRDVFQSTWNFYRVCFGLLSWKCRFERWVVSLKLNAKHARWPSLNCVIIFVIVFVIKMNKLRWNWTIDIFYLICLLLRILMPNIFSGLGPQANIRIVFGGVGRYVKISVFKNDSSMMKWRLIFKIFLRRFRGPKIWIQNTMSLLIYEFSEFWESLKIFEI